MSERIAIYTDEEIDIFLKGDRRNVDKLLLHGMNNIAAALVPHMEKEDSVMAVMGDATAVRERSAWIDAEIAKKKAWAEFWKESRLELARKGTWAIVLVVLALVIYFWNGHMPESAHIPPITKG